VCNTIIFAEGRGLASDCATRQPSLRNPEFFGSESARRVFKLRKPRQNTPVAAFRRVLNKPQITLTAKGLTAANLRSSYVRIVLRYCLFLLVILLFAPGVFGQECPIVSVTCPDSSDGDSITFHAMVTGNPDKVNFKWTVSAGTITAGQATSSITVIGPGLDGQTLTATVEVEGIPKECASTASCSVRVCGIPLPRKLDEYGAETKPLPAPRSSRRVHRRTNKARRSHPQSLTNSRTN
jgi:hypothetical protein